MCRNEDFNIKCTNPDNFLPRDRLTIIQKITDYIIGNLFIKIYKFIGIILLLIRATLQRSKGKNTGKLVH